jgi:hypothetical protein
MKIACLAFVISFLAGYAAFSWLNSNWRDVMIDEAYIALTSTSSELRLSDEYEELMLDQEEHYQISLDRANGLTELFGLAEKMNQKYGFDSYSYSVVAKKLARLFPQQSLDYFGVRPTHAAMNREMYRFILYEWADLDFKACMSFLANRPYFHSIEFKDYWRVLALNRMESHPQDCIDAFNELNKEKQRYFIEQYGSTDALLESLMPAAKDQEFVAETRKKQELEKQQLEELAERENHRANKIDTQAAKLRDLWEYSLPDSDVVVESICALETRTERREMLDWVTQPSIIFPDEPQAWLQRVSKVMQEVGDVPFSAPHLPQRKRYAYRSVLEEWLPKQSTEMQRAWAESVVRFQDTHEALAWIEKLKTPSLRHDMRILKWKPIVAREPKEAATKLIQTATQHEQEIHLPEAVYGWAKHDFAAAKQWLEAQPDSEAKTQALQKIEVK